MEPIFAASYRRKILDEAGTAKDFLLTDYALGFGAGAAKGLPNGFCAASEAVEAGKMLGIVTKFDFLHAFAFTTRQIVPHFDELMRRTVADVMTEAVVHVELAAPLTRVLQLMEASRAAASRSLAPMVS